MSITLSFDVYGTLVDPGGIIENLLQDVGAKATEFADCWSDRQHEYSFRRGIMRDYADFSICRRDALEFACQRFEVDIARERRTELLGLYGNLPAFSDVKPALDALQGVFRLFALANGKRTEIAEVLANANISQYFEGIITTDEVRSFKPDPVVYHHAKRVMGTLALPCWLVSSSPWDLIGGGSAGLATAWVRRSEEEVYASWGAEPNVTIRSLIDLPTALATGL